MALFKSKRKKVEELMTTGSRADGTAVLVQDTGMTVNDNPRIKMTFRVEPLDGSSAFDTTKETTVSRVSIPPEAPMAAAPQGQAQDTVEQLKQLADLHQQGLLTDHEFNAQKAKLLRNYS